jgi:predicted Zn finger-like uncharacterized protein
MTLANSSMHIVCPNCTTSYAVNAATFGDAGRNVRCARCKEVWLAHPENVSLAQVPALAVAEPSPPDQDMSAWGLTDDDSGEAETADIPRVDSPSISADWPDEARAENAEWTSMARDDHKHANEPGKPSRLRALSSRLAGLRLLPALALPRINLSIACATMAALVLALMIWRVDVVRLMPQTAGFYRLVGLNVNLRGLTFKDVKVTSETVDGKPVLVVEGNIVGESRTKPVALPRLRFIVRDAHGSEIYAWTAVLEQQGLNPGDKAWFKSRLASPPAEARAIDVRFFNKNDLGA